MMLAGWLLAGIWAAYAADDGGATYGVVQLRAPGGKVRSGGEPFTLTMDEDVLVDVKEPCQWLSEVLIQRANSGQTISNPFKTDPTAAAVERYKAEYACEKLVEDRLKNSFPMVMIKTVRVFSRNGAASTRRRIVSRT
jgi:hypothetical protein